MKNPIKRVESLLHRRNPVPDKALKILAPLAKRKDTSWPVYYYIGLAYIHKKDFETALRWLKKALPDSTDRALTYHAISICHYNLGAFLEAESFEKKALEKENFYNGWKHLGMIYRARAELKEALECYKKAAVLEPDNSELAYKIAEIYRDQGRLDKALELFEYTIGNSENEPVNNASHVAMAQVLIQKNRYEEARDHLDKILERDLSNVQARIIRADLYRKQGNYKKAMELCKQLLDEDSAMAKVRLNYGVCLQELGRFDEAEKQYVRALADDPEEYQSLSNYLMCIHYNPERSKREIFEAHLLWDLYFGQNKRPERPVPDDKTNKNKLRIGFLSGGFMCHPVGWMITRGLEHLHEDQFEIYCYSTGRKHDYITQRINRAADKWRSVVGYNDEVIAGMIKDDEIDILVELSGHAADNRLRTITREPAPVIVKWVGGLFNTTGLKAVDYLITDWYESPAGEEEFYTEKLVRLPDDYICYMPPEYAPEVSKLPAEENNYVTFGCFNNPSKVNSEILDRWALIMNQIPGSRFILKSKQYETAPLKNRIITRMESAGISADRIIFRGETNHRDHLECYNQIDIALDPWPYSGGVTTCEALWMGVPVITMPGSTFAGRHSATHLQNADFPEWIADSWDGYIATAVSLAKDLAKLAKLRREMRKRVEESPLCDARRFAAHLSVAFRKMWQQRVDGYSTETENWRAHIEVEALPEKNIKNYTGDRRVKKENHTPLQDEGFTVATDSGSGILSDNETGELKINTSLNKQSEKMSINGNGMIKNHNQNEHNIFQIETKDEITICTPADLNQLTPYVLLENESWFEPELAFVRDYLQPGMSVLDAGAAFGAYSLPMAKLVGKDGKIWAFEPGSTAARYLEESRNKNAFEQLEIRELALGDKTGLGYLKQAQTPELNILADEEGEEVSVATLDEWWKSNQKPHLDFIKIDVNGMEGKVLDGAGKTLSEISPVLMIGIGEIGEEELGNIEQNLKEKSYELYEYVPGPRLLTHFDPNEEIDPYLMNLIAFRDDKKKIFSKKGWIYDNEVKTEEPQEMCWRSVLDDFPWSNSLMPQWKNLNVSDHSQYFQALNNLCVAKKLPIEASGEASIRSRKGKLLEKSAQQLVELYNSGNTGYPVSMSLARVLNALGKRGQAVEIMERLMRDNKYSAISHADLPFMLPLPEQDSLAIHTDLKKWLTVRTVEAWMSLKNVSTYFSGEEELSLLGMLDKNPESAPVTRKKSILSNELHGSGSTNNISFNIHLNHWFWNSRTIDSKRTDQENKSKSIVSSCLPSEIIEAKVNCKGSGKSDPIYIKIPKREMFRLNNIFNDDEYSLPDGFRISADSVIVDIGANVGAFALYAAQWNKEATIYCFEPNAQVAPLLETNTKQYANIDRNYFALGESDGELELYQHPVNTGQSSTSHAIKGGNTINVEVRHSGSVLNERGVTDIDVLKIDTEGAEVPILAGLKEFLPRTKVVMLEYHSEADRRKIDELLPGFLLYAADVQKLWGIGTVKYINKKLLNR